MADLTILVSPTDPLFSIEAPEHGADQNSYYNESSEDRGPPDINSIWYDYQAHYGRQSMINPIVDWYAAIYGSGTVNDIDAMASSFDLMAGLFASNNNYPRSWFLDDRGTYQTYVAAAPAIDSSTLTRLKLTDGGADSASYNTSGQIVVTAPINVSGFSASDLRYISLNLQDASIPAQAGPTYQQYYITELSKAKVAFLGFEKILTDKW